MTRQSPIFAALAVAALALAGCHKTPATNTAYNNSGSSATPGSSVTSSTTTTESTTSNAAAGSSSATTTPSSAPTGDTSSPAATTGSIATSATPAASGNVVTDTVQTGKVKAAFASETGLKDADISVDTKDGVVTLSGTAKSREQIALATSVAQRQEGVTRVDSQIVVK
jgi:hyperosmotically inducible protein